jgi:hypothetical protein
MALINVFQLYHSDNIRARVFAAIAQAARAVLSESLPTSNLAYDSSSGLNYVTLVTNGAYNFWVGKLVVLSDSAHSEELTISRISGNNVLYFTTNLVNTYTVANGAKVTMKTDVERLTWAQNTRKLMDDWVNTFMWDIVSDSTIQAAGEACTDVNITDVINANINAYASTL